MVVSGVNCGRLLTFAFVTGQVRLRHCVDVVLLFSLE